MRIVTQLGLCAPSIPRLDFVVARCTFRVWAKGGEKEQDFYDMSTSTTSPSHKFQGISTDENIE